MARSPPRRRHTGHPRDYRHDRGDLRRSISRDRRYGGRESFDARRDRDRDRERDYHHQSGRRDDRFDDRALDRPEDPRPPRRDRSRDRKRSREQASSPVRDSRRHSRDSHRRDRDVYDDRDRKRRRRGSSGSRNEASRPSTADAEAAAAEEAKQAEKLAKVEAWKKTRKQNQNAAPDSPSTAAESTVHDRPRPKFDHKEIKKRAAEKMLQHSKKSTLGADAVLPMPANGKADGNVPAASHPPTLPTVPAKSDPSLGSQLPKRSVADLPMASKIKSTGGKISAFGLSTSTSDKDTDRNNTSEAATALEEDDNVKRQFKKLPDLPQMTDTDESMAVDGEDEQDGELADDLRSDDEEAEAARAALQKRAQEGDTKMNEATLTSAEAATINTQQESASSTSPTHDNTAEDEGEEIDPLDAYMASLEPAPSARTTTGSGGLAKSHGPQVFDDDDDDFSTMDAVSNDPKDLLNLPKRNKKDIPIVDHSKMEYDDFRKDFYTESPEIAQLTDEEAQALRADLDNISINGKNAPKPIVKWSQGGFGVQILDILREHKFEAPTSIQSQALPALMSGRDTIGIAKTGSGKTLAFILPMFRHIQDQPKVANMEGPIALVLAPTRELAVQIHRECKPYLNALKLRGVCAYGGAPIKEQIAELKRGAEVVVCTPGRFIDLLAANQGRVTNLRRVTYCVLDEADRMFDMGFEPQISRILGNIRPNRQTVLFSATFPSKMEYLARKATQKPIQITVGGRSVVAAEITQIVEVRGEDTKFTRVLELLGKFLYADDGTRVLIFVERQETADALFRDLGRKAYPSVPVHGGREQIDRDQAISDFKAGHMPIMIATSVAARGLDVKQLNLVINYDSPNHGEDYVHRVGRTGRAGNTGTAVTFVTPEQERFAPFLVRALEESKQEVPTRLQEMVTSFNEKVQSGQAYKGDSGFGGKGIERLEAARDAERAREKKQYKTGDEPDEEEETDSKKTADVKNSSLEEQIAKAMGVVKDRDAPSEQSASERLSKNLASKLTDAMNISKAEKGPEPDTKDPLALVQARAAQISSRLGNRGAGRTPSDNHGPDAGAWSGRLEINDFPQKARWAVTNRTNVSRILTDTGVSITSKGIWYPSSSKEPGPGEEAKLNILVEGDTYNAVVSAMRTLTDLLREGTLRAFEDEARVKGGRYDVV